MFAFLFACSEYVVNETQEIAPVQPPADDFDPWGETPDWEGCQQGYFGSYYNLTSNHEDIEPTNEIYAQENHALLNWWNEEFLAFERFDASLDFGTNWWPIDEGFEGDPKYFSAKWTAWIRVFETKDIEFLIGASDDFWLEIDNTVVFMQAGITEFDAKVWPVSLDEGQYKLSIHYAHRSNDSGLRFRNLSEEAVICYPDFETEEE